jgi:hypothetical protein
VRTYKKSIFATAEGVNKSQVNLFGTPTVKVDYTITDGGALDEDGLTNGIIVDPIGLAMLNPATPVPSTNNSNNPTNTANQNSITQINPAKAVLIRTGGQ